MSFQNYKKKKGYRGYIFSRKIDGNFIPQRVQNLVIKDFATRKGLFLNLCNRVQMENCYLMLKSVLKNIKSIDGVIFYSVFMLPEKNEERKKYLLFL